MRFMLAAACLASVLTLSAAHLCLISPHQRGSMKGLDAAGSDDCILLTAPCGGRLPGAPLVTYRAGSNATVIFQKNLDHWVKATPGYFSVSLIHGTTTMLADIPDMGEPSLHLYTAVGLVPSGLTGRATLQVQYVTKNPGAPPIFYQCADVNIA